MSTKLIAKNKRAYFNYEILEKMESGIVLNGCEVKSIRNGKLNFRDSYARVDNGEAWLINCYIAPYEQAHGFSQTDPSKTRKLLLHKKEINKLIGKTQEKGLTLVPLSMYFKRGTVKVELGLGKSKKKHDKRASIKERETNRELNRALKNHR